MLSVSAEAEDRRNELAQSALAITKITCADENNLARNIAVEIRNHLKEVESTRTQLTKPLLDAQRMLKRLTDDHILPLTLQLGRIETLATGFAMTEKARADAEAKARFDLASEAKTDADFQAVMAEPIVEASRAQGQQLRQVLKWEVTDINALYQARPDLCRIEPKASAIQASCVPELPTPGLRCWWEKKATFTTR